MSNFVFEHESAISDAFAVIAIILGHAIKVFAIVMPHVYAVVVFALRHAIDISIYFENSFPTITSWIRLLVGAYVAYKTSRKVIRLWYKTTLLVFKFCLVNFVIVLGIYVYLRGVSNIVAIDYPSLKSAVWDHNPISTIKSATLSRLTGYGLYVTQGGYGNQVKNTFLIDEKLLEVPY